MFQDEQDSILSILKKSCKSCPTTNQFGDVVEPFSIFSPSFTIQSPELMSLK